MSKHRIVLILTLLSLIVVWIPGLRAQDSEVEDLTFFLTFVPNIQFAPLYVTIEKGYFADQGLNVDIEHGREPDGVDLIAADQMQFGLISGEQILLARAGQRPVKYVYEWFQKYPVAVVFPAGSAIESVADLAGRKVGVPSFSGATYSGIVALLAANAMTPDDLALEPIGFNAVEVVCLGGVEASVVYINNEPLQIQQRVGQGDCGDISDVEVIAVGDFADLVSNGIVTNEETINNNPALVQRVVSAFDAGLRDAINNPAEAYLLSLPYIESLVPDDEFITALESAAADQEIFLGSDPDRMTIAESRQTLYESLSGQFDAETLTQFQVLLATIDLWDAEQLGFSDLVSWEVTQATLAQMGFLEEAIDLEAAFTNEFVPAAQG